MTDSYDDIINLPHHVSANHKPMTMTGRAAQFAPFAALAGHEAAIREAARVTDRMERDETTAELLDRKISLIMASMPCTTEVSITYFIPDDRKAGGKYVTVTGTVKSIDETNRVIKMHSGPVIPIDTVTNIVGEMFTCIF